MSDPVVRALEQLDGPVAPPERAVAQVRDALHQEMRRHEVWPENLAQLTDPVRGWAPAAAGFASVLITGLLLWVLTPQPRAEPPMTVPPSPTSTTTTSEPPTAPVAWARAGQFQDGFQAPDGVFPIDVAHDGEALWVLAAESPREEGVAPESARLYQIGGDGSVILESDEIAGSPESISASDGRVWVSRPGAAAISVHDAASGRDLMRFERFNFNSLPLRVTLAGGAGWVVTASLELLRLDPLTGAVDVVRNQGINSFDLVVVEDELWAAADTGVIRVDLAIGEAEHVPLAALDHAVQHIDYDGELVYLADGQAGHVTAIWPGSLDVFGSTELPIAIHQLGWIDAFFGAINAEGQFWHLDPVPSLTTQASVIDLRDMLILKRIGRESWMIDDVGGTVVPVHEIRPLPTIEISLPEVEEVDETLDVVSPDWERVQSIEGAFARRIAQLNEVLLFWGDPAGIDQLITREPIDIYDASTDTWRSAAPSPYEEGRTVTFVAAGDLLYTWGTQQAAVYDVTVDEWRVLEEWPLSPSPSHTSREIIVWTGSEILDLRSGRAVNPSTGAERTLDSIPRIHERGAAVVAGGLVVSLTGEGALNVSTGEWIRLPSSGLTPLALGGVAVEDGLYAADYLMNSARFDPAALRWTRLAPLPVRFFECGMDLVEVGGRPIAISCAGWAAWDFASESWIPIAYPKPFEAQTLFALGDELFAGGDALFRLDSDVLGEPTPTPQLVRLGLRSLRLDEGWALVSVESPIAEGPVTAAIERQDSQCFVTAFRAGDHRTALMSYAGAGWERVAIDRPGRSALDAMHVPADVVDDLVHVVWAVGTTDLVDIACESFDDAREVVALIVP